jgi:hypothetical protein
MNSQALGPADDRAVQEESVLRQFAMRWSVLAAWADALHLRRVPLPEEVASLLESARIKTASGCFSVCEVGCDLSRLEAELTTADSSTDHNWVDFWLDLLGHAMAEGEETERLLKVPAVRFHYANCGVKGCAC